jgi:hypothetical protein
VAQTYNPGYLGGRDQEDQSLRPAWANSLRNSISKIIRTKWTGHVPQEVECLLCKCGALSSNPSPTKKRKKRKLCLWVIIEKEKPRYGK